MMNSVFVHPVEGAGPVERDALHTWRWCAKDIDIAIYNRLVKSQPLDMGLTLYTGYDQATTAQIEYASRRDEVQINRSGQQYRRMLTVPPGRSILRIRTDARRFDAPGDSRALFVRLQDLHVQQPGWAGVLVQWGQGYFMLERDRAATWRWSGPRAVMTLTNNSQELATAIVRAAFRTGHAEPAKLRISGLISEELRINSTDKMWSAKLIVPPGAHQLIFECDARPVDAPNDPRVMVFWTKDFEITSLYPEDSFLLMD
jgi:hypothetical protein